MRREEYNPRLSQAERNASTIVNRSMDTLEYGAGAIAGIAGESVPTGGSRLSRSADRRPDLSYMIAPEESVELNQWMKQLASVIQEYAQKNNVRVRALAEPRLEN